MFWSLTLKSRKKIILIDSDALSNFEKKMKKKECQMKRLYSLVHSRDQSILAIKDFRTNLIHASVRTTWPNLEGNAMYFLQFYLWRDNGRNHLPGIPCLEIWRSNLKKMTYSLTCSLLLFLHDMIWIARWNACESWVKSWWVYSGCSSGKAGESRAIFDLVLRGVISLVKEKKRIFMGKSIV